MLDEFGGQPPSRIRSEDCNDASWLLYIDTHAGKVTNPWQSVSMEKLHLVVESHIKKGQKKWHSMFHLCNTSAESGCNTKIKHCPGTQLQNHETIQVLKVVVI